MGRNRKDGMNCKNCMNTAPMVKSGKYGKKCRKCKNVAEMVKIAIIPSFYQFSQKFPKMAGNGRGEFPLTGQIFPHMYMELVLTIS